MKEVHISPSMLSLADRCAYAPVLRRMERPGGKQGYHPSYGSDTHSRMMAGVSFESAFLQVKPSFRSPSEEFAFRAWERRAKKDTLNKIHRYAKSARSRFVSEIHETNILIEQPLPGDVWLGPMYVDAIATLVGQDKPQILDVKFVGNLDQWWASGLLKKLQVPLYQIGLELERDTPTGQKILDMMGLLSMGKMAEAMDLIPQIRLEDGYYFMVESGSEKSSYDEEGNQIFEAPFVRLQPMHTTGEDVMNIYMLLHKIAELVREWGPIGNVFTRKVNDAIRMNAKCTGDIIEKGACPMLSLCAHGRYIVESASGITTSDILSDINI